jgi:hypothetical protein
VVTILTSAVGLGIYIPALLIERQLRALGIAAEVEVLEGYYTAGHQQAHIAHREAHHASFALAQIAHRMARGVDHCHDSALLDALLERWRSEDRRDFIVWAGFWLPILRRYADVLGGEALRVDHCRIDAVVSASFKVHPDLDRDGREIWLWNWKDRRLEHEIGVGNAPPVPFDARDLRLVVHGGGWNIGTYRDRIPELASTPYALDVVVHDRTEATLVRSRDRAFMLDPAWCAWRRTAGEHTFPSMQRLADRTAIDFHRNADHHAMHDVIRCARGIVSKPGGSTLIDSLAAATPVILLEAYGYAEEANARIWEALGFGISYSAWRESGYDDAVLARLHANILQRSPGVDYVRAYAAQLAEIAT